jgi:hypothetical protein
MNEVELIEREMIGTSEVPTRDQIDKAERYLAQMETRVFDIPVVHHHLPGMYAREMRIPAGIALTGKTHRHAHLNVLSEGEITVWTEEGMKRLKAPFRFESKPGTKRIGYAHTDVVWTTYHPTWETDLELIEAEVIEPSENLVSLDVKQVLK